MSAARSEYVRLCSEHHVKPLKAVLKQLPDNNARGLECIKVDLSGELNAFIVMCMEHSTLYWYKLHVNRNLHSVAFTRLKTNTDCATMATDGRWHLSLEGERNVVVS